MSYAIKNPKTKVKMGVYKNGELIDFGYYENKEEAEADFQKFDKPRGRTHIIEEE